MHNIGHSAPMDLLSNSASPAKRELKEDRSSDKLEKRDLLSSEESFKRELREKSKEKSLRQEKIREDRADAQSRQEKTRGPEKSPIQEKAISRETREESDTARVDDQEPSFFHNEIDKHDRENNFEKAKKKEAMSKFMDSLESELGISPESIIEAMKTLSPAERRSSERSMAQVLAKLDLEGSDVDAAADLYGRFLKDMSRGDFNADSRSLKNEISGMDPSMLSPVEQRRMRHRQSIDQITSGFLTGPKFSDGRMQEVGHRTNQELALTKIMTQFTNVNRNNPANVSNEYMQYSQGGIEPLTRSMTPAQQFSVGDLQMAEQYRNAMLGGQGYGDSLGSMQGEGSSNTAANNLAQASTSGGGFAIDSMMTADGQSQFGSSEGFSGFDGESTGQDFFDATPDGEAEGLESFMQSQTAQTAGKASGPTSLQALINNSLEGAEPEVSNMNEVVDKAQVMIKKGGGEVKMLLNPEGLGQVDLKVNVKDGQVNIQMMTEHPQAKKALEGQLQDLKDNLSLQKLNVESVKIDVSTELAKNFEEQQGEAERNYAREFARDFMGGRREGNMFNQGGFFDSPTQKYFMQDRDGVEPLAMNQGLESTSTKKNPNGRLNLVA